MRPANRPIDGDALADILKDLARIEGLASSLKIDLDPIAPENEDDAEALTFPQIQAVLDDIATKVTNFALFKIHATKEEWYKAHDDLLAEE